MAKILAVGTCGTNDPTKASFPFITAAGALAAEKEVAIALLGEAVYLAKPALAKTVHGVGFRPLPQIIEEVIQGKVPVYL